MKKAPLGTRTRLRNHSQSNGNELDNGQLLAALMAFKRGDFSARLPEDWTGVPGKIADTFNAVIEANERMTRELERIGRVVGKERSEERRVGKEWRARWGLEEEKKKMEEQEESKA